MFLLSPGFEIYYLPLNSDRFNSVDDAREHIFATPIPPSRSGTVVAQSLHGTPTRSRRLPTVPAFGLTNISNITPERTESRDYCYQLLPINQIVLL